ncbi:unnamed protein product [Cyprideis torosa]|uniref:Uncharacterized protein n=1 Tax=Cyprideis torosa TaxID=163714 RepID=A0A7R8WKH3_9CRUS|nr:unnamed protein product [Cyprideis torosa]CAG0896960.1 unnamed protein product [Cyprideis torosa]
MEINCGYKSGGLEMYRVRDASLFIYRLLDFKVEGGTHKTKKKFLELQSEITHDPFDNEGLMVSDMVGGLILLLRFPFPYRVRRTCQ